MGGKILFICTEWT